MPPWEVVTSLHVSWGQEQPFPSSPSLDPQLRETSVVPALGPGLVARPAAGWPHGGVQKPRGIRLFGHSAAITYVSFHWYEAVLCSPSACSLLDLVDGLPLNPTL